MLRRSWLTHKFCSIINKLIVLEREMRIRLPHQTKYIYAITRLVCAAATVIILLILSGISGTGQFLRQMQTRISMENSPLSLIYWILLFIVLYTILSKITQSLWRSLETKQESIASIKSSDLRIDRTRGIAGIPFFQNDLNRAVQSSEHNTVDIINTILSIGFSLDASDIHISPAPEKAEVILRVHGNLYPLGEIDMRTYSHFINRIKILSGLSIFQKRIPQDGQLNIQDRSYAVRVSVFPTVSGERIALRLSSTHSAIMDLENIGMPEIILLDYKAFLNRNQGMIVITGPTGSGKTTTLHSSLLYIQKQRRNNVNIVTLEDPIETRLPGLQQTQVEQDTGLTFSSGLRSVLRQDPDVIMLGEIRDEETATIAIRAAMTGHLLLTTVHANSTSGVFNKLSQIGLHPVQLSSTVRAVISQRLCRQLCQSCRKEIQLTESHARQLKLLGVNELPEGPFYESEGCDECFGRGFTGRVALFEMLMVTEQLRDFISSGVPAHVLSKETKLAGMPSLLDHGFQLARAGRISLMEMARVVSD